MDNPAPPAALETLPQDEVPLEDIDRFLAEEDPDFAKSLEEVRSVEVDKDVVIEAAAIDESMVGDEGAVNANGGAEGFKRPLNKVRAALVAFRLGFRSRALQAGRSTILFLKTGPKEFSLFALAIAFKIFTELKVPAKAFAAAPWFYKIGVVLLAAVLAGGLTVFTANLKGIWIPHLTEPILTSLENKADFVGTYDEQDGAESFYAAFPQEVHEFLFKKIKVNLRRRADNPNPMGAFEIVVEVDSKDTAVELRDREVEFHDLLQRLMEEESVTDLDSENGKKILKGRIKKDLNAKLTQGWLKDIHFRTFVLKP